MLEHNDLGIAFGCKEGEIWIPKVRSVTDNCINKTEMKKKNYYFNYEYERSFLFNNNFNATRKN